MNEIPSGHTMCPKTKFVTRFAEKMGMEYSEASFFLNSMVDSPMENKDEDSDKFELMLAVNMNAKLHDIHDGSQFKRFKFMLNNDSQKAVNLARLWLSEKISFEEMLVSF